MIQGFKSFFFSRGRILTLPPAPKNTLKGGHRTVASLFGVHPLGCSCGSKLWWQCQDAPFSRQAAHSLTVHCIGLAPEIAASAPPTPFGGDGGKVAVSIARKAILPLASLAYVAIVS